MGYNTPEPYCQPPFQPSSSYTSFSTQPIEEPIYLEKIMKSMIQSPNDPFDRLEEKMDRMQGLMNVQISRLSNILELTNQIDKNQESWYLEDLDQYSISSHQRELDQSQPLDKLTSFNFNEIDLDCECEPDP